jgi:hypothetical protein
VSCLDCVSCVVAVLENPYAEMGYVRLQRCYDSCGMLDESKAIEFLVEKKFDADRSDIIEEQ